MCDGLTGVSMFCGVLRGAACHQRCTALREVMTQVTVADEM